MKKLRIVTLIGISGFVSGAAFVAACSDSDTVITGNDSGTGTETSTPPTPPNPPGPTDAGDGGDGGIVTVPDFVAKIESSFCSALTRCCFNDPNLADGGDAGGTGVYNGDKCRTIIHNRGFEFSSVGAELVDGGAVTIDSAKAEACANALNSLDCSLGGPALISTRAACYEAFVGHVALGETCQASIECASGNFCNPADHKCTALHVDGGSCNVFSGGADEDDSVKDEEACSSRGGGDTKYRCDSYDFVGGAYRDRADWTCQPTVDNGEGCNSTVWCKAGICDVISDVGGFTCKSPLDYFNLGAAACSAVVLP